ncbi:MAG: type IV secretory system conjugative DNA transfer family protein [Bacilli bacterium]|nr:type IV secretory system conjugative DNA transfer family protein [Bacilli bacterium]
MKFNFRADPEDFLIFVLFAIFLLYIVALAVANVGTFTTEGHLSGLNPFPAFSPRFIGSTIIFYIVALLGLFASVSSMFFDREKGIGLTIDKKDKGYSRWAKDKEIKEELECVQLNAKNSKAAGIPLIINEKEMWVDNGEYHSLVIGATGSGKTQGLILPMVHSLSKAKESMIITDPKGEIYEETSNMLRSRGYQILLLNFRDPQNGNAWNPMSLPYQMYKSGNQDKAIELLDDLALNILYDDTNKNADPFWEKTSADYFSGVALGLFEDAKEEEININSISLATTVGEEKFGGSTYIKEYFAGKDPASAAAVNASSTIMAPNETKGSILSVFKQKVKLFASRENLSEMLSHSDIDLESIGEKPTAVFIVIQDEKKTYHSLVTILLKQIYETLISTAQKHGGKLPVRTNFLLDEFANMPPLKDVTTMITAARSRRIRFTMIIQNFAQLDDVYGKEDAETIRGNCGNIIYLITTELKALEEISKMCGEEKSKQDEKTSSTPLVTVSDLQRMKQYEVVILRLRKQPFKTKLIPNHKINWGAKYPPAKYPVRKKVPVHTFDIKEFVKSEKKKKLLEMMNSTDNNDTKMDIPFGGGMMPGAFGGIETHSRRDDSIPAIPDFLVRKDKKDAPTNEPANSPFNGVPDFETFKKSMDEEIDKQPKSRKTPKEETSAANDEFGFDLDELVKKIDAKIAELEADEKREKEEQERIQKEQQEKEKKEKPSSIEEVLVEKEVPKTEPVVSNKPAIDLDDDDDDDDFFDDFFDN